MLGGISVRNRRKLVRPFARTAMALVVLGALACSLLEGSPPPDDESDDDDDDNSGCNNGDVLQCVGPQGCSGLTLCENGRVGQCICGVGGTTGAGGASPTGGVPSGGVAGTSPTGGAPSG